MPDARRVTPGPIGGPKPVQPDPKPVPKPAPTETIGETGFVGWRIVPPR